MTPGKLNRGPGYEEHIYDFTTKYLARDTGTWPGPGGAGAGGGAPRHGYFGSTESGAAATNCETWRFPLVEPHYDPAATAAECAEWNEVTFVYATKSPVMPGVTVLGLPFPELQSLPLSQVGDSIYLASTVLLPARRVYRYALVVDGKLQPDPLNLQRVRLANGEELSAFFTDGCFTAITFEPWELTLLRRLTNHILPFNSHEAELFQLRPGGGPAAGLTPQLYRLDHGVGAANYIDKVLAREERHQLTAYKTCLAQINRILRSRNPYLEPRDMPEDAFVGLYNEMASGSVPGWDYTGYSSPGYFLFLLRRHTFVGAFCHPKYGGNANGSAWLWLGDLFRGTQGQTLFDWERSLEPPFGTSAEYRG